MWGGQRWWFLMLDFMSHWFSPSISFSPSLFCLHHHPTRLKFTASWASLEVESCTMTPPVWDIPKELRWRKILPVGRTLSSASTHSLCSGEKMARCEIIYRFMDCSHRFALMVRELEGTMIIIKLENWWQGNLGKRYRDIFLNEQQMWRYLCPSECSPKSDLSREF